MDGVRRDRRGRRPSRDYALTHFTGLDELEQSNLRLLLRDTPDFAANLQREVTQALERLGVSATTTNGPLATKIVLEARAAAARSCRLGVLPDGLAERLTLGAAAPMAAGAAVPGTPVAAPLGPGSLTPEQVPEPWRSMSPTEVADRMIAENPKMFEHRQRGKRATEQTGEQTLRQIRWAARLLQMALPGRPMWTIAHLDIKILDAWFERLPVSFGKSERDRLENVTLEVVAERAAARVAEGELDGSQIGLMIPTANKHFRKIAQVHGFLQDKVPGLADLRIGKYVLPDRKDEREARLRYSLEQGRAIFSLPPWIGCMGEGDRLSPGNAVIHDSLFFVLLLVWYTGARREEICKLRLADVDEVDGISFLRIATTDTGRVKNSSAVRCIPVAGELVRLGFLRYVDALRADGETLLFPEIAPAEGTKRKRGDVFYKLWWIYIRPMVPSLIRGQAMHSARHSVSDELKQQGIFLEFRNDLLGHKGKGGEGETRYSLAARLGTVLDIVDRIPIVTDHLPDVAVVTLLPRSARQPRPTRGG